MEICSLAEKVNKTDVKKYNQLLPFPFITVNVRMGRVRDERREQS